MSFSQPFKRHYQFIILRFRSFIGQRRGKTLANVSMFYSGPSHKHFLRNLRKVWRQWVLSLLT